MQQHWRPSKLSRNKGILFIFLFCLMFVSLWTDLSPLFFYICFFVGFATIREISFPNSAYEIDHESEKLNLEHWLKSGEYIHISWSARWLCDNFTSVNFLRWRGTKYSISESPSTCFEEQPDRLKSYKEMSKYLTHTETNTNPTI